MHAAPDAQALAVLRHPALERPETVAVVGARELPPEGLAVCAAIGRALAWSGHAIRTGGAPGADQAYAAAADAEGGAVTVVLPWDAFEAHGIPAAARVIVADPWRHAGWFARAGAHAPRRHYPGAAPEEAARLAARNVGIVEGGAGVGSRAGLCVAVHGGVAPSGGTAHALECARAARVPALVFAVGDVACGERTARARRLSA